MLCLNKEQLKPSNKLNNTISTTILTQLFLYSVLPALSKLIIIDEKAQSIIKNKQFNINLGVINKINISIILINNQINCITQNQTNKNSTDLIKLRFINQRHLNQFFLGNTRKPPLLLKGYTQIKALNIFSQLTQRLDYFLQSKIINNTVYTQLIFYIIGKSLPILAYHDPITKNILKKTPYGLAEFYINHPGIESIWFEHLGDKFSSGHGRPPRIPDARICFTNIHIANKVLINQVDTWAEIGLGGIKIQGLIPLADGISLIMEQLDVYLNK